MAASARAYPVLLEAHETRLLPVAANAELYKGWLVSFDAGGDLIESADTSGLPFAGVMMETVKNTSAFGGGSDGAMFARVCTKGRVIVEGDSTLADPNADGLRKKAYVLDGDSVANSGTTTNVYAGFVSAFEDVEDPLSRSNAVILNFGYDAI